MKRIYFLTATGFIFSLAANAQSGEVAMNKKVSTLRRQEQTLKKEERKDKRELRTLEGNEVSYQATQAFNEDFRNTPIIASERERNFDRFTFRQKGAIVSAYYDVRGKLVGTLQHEHYADIPKVAQKRIKEIYPGYTPEDVIYFNDNEANDTNMMLYGDEFDDADAYFVELKSDAKRVVVQVSPDGEVWLFKTLY